MHTISQESTAASEPSSAKFNLSNKAAHAGTQLEIEEQRPEEGNMSMNMIVVSGFYSFSSIRLNVLVRCHSHMKSTTFFLVGAHNLPGEYGSQ